MKERLVIGKIRVVESYTVTRDEERLLPVD